MPIFEEEEKGLSNKNSPGEVASSVLLIAFENNFLLFGSTFKKMTTEIIRAAPFSILFKNMSNKQKVEKLYVSMSYIVKKIYID